MEFIGAHISKAQELADEMIGEGSVQPLDGDWLGAFRSGGELIEAETQSRLLDAMHRQARSPTDSR